MTFELPIAERRLRFTSRMLHQGMWLMLLAAACLLLLVRTNISARTGSLWLVGCGILAFMLSFALRDVVRKVGHRNTEDKLVKEVKTFLEREPTELIERPVVVRVERKAEAAASVPGLPGFVALKGVSPYSAPAGDPVVFDAIPAREAVTVKMDLYAVLLPVLSHC